MGVERRSCPASICPERCGSMTDGIPGRPICIMIVSGRKPCISAKCWMPLLEVRTKWKGHEKKISRNSRPGATTYLL